MSTEGPYAAESARGGRSGEVDLRTLLVDSAVDYAIFALDVDGHILTWNPGAARLKGYTADEIIGQHFSTFYPQEDVDRGWPDRELAAAVAEGRFEDEGWRLRKDGSRFWANVVITALRGPDGRLLGFGKVTRDLTERKAGEDMLRESEERFRLLVSAVADYAIFLLNPDGTVASWNVGAERLKGYRADEIVGRHFSVFYTADDRAGGLPDQGLRAALEDGRWLNEGWRVRKDGSRFWADVVITALYGSDGVHRGFAKVTRDLTERKATEDALRGILERERETAAQLRELDRMKTDLVAIVAHDLRGPVGLIQNLLESLETDWDVMDDDQRRDLVRRMAHRSVTLAALVDDIFDVARIDAGELDVDPHAIDVAAVIDQVVADARDMTPDRDLRVVIAAPVEALADERRTWQILSNLVSNAVKYSPADTPVDIKLERIGQEVLVSIEDQGPGIEHDDEAAAFARFGRLRGTKGVPGSGLGLFIARSLAEAQGGRLWVESEPGRGATFFLALPANDEP
jgi:PAS domain S-box-containing protein